jgi:hypothetical protein
MRGKNVTRTIIHRVFYLQQHKEDETKGNNVTLKPMMIRKPNKTLK